MVRKRTTKKTPKKTLSRGKKNVGARQGRPKVQGPLSRLATNFRRVRTNLLKARAEWKEAEKDLLAFETWRCQEFDKEAGEIEQLESQLQQTFMRLVVTQSRVESGEYDSPKEAWQDLVEQEKENAENAVPPTPPEEDDELIDEVMSDILYQKGIDPNSLSEEELERSREKVRESIRHGRDDNKTAFTKTLMSIGADESQESLKKVKSAWRVLVKRLHPDKAKEFGELEAELWREAEAAYQAKDAASLIRLEVYHRTLCREELVPTDEIPLENLIDELNYEKDDYRGRLKEARESAGWRFSHVSESAKSTLARSMRAGMNSVIAGLKKELKRLQAEEANLTNPPKKKTPSRKKTAIKKKTKAKKETTNRKKTSRETNSNDNQIEFDF